MSIPRAFLRPTCAECGRRFDLTDAADADEWAYGHDCEPAQPESVADVLARYGYRIIDHGPNAGRVVKDSAEVES